MKKSLFIFGILLLSTALIHAEPIADVDSRDTSYKAIENSINNGYLTLFEDNNFRPKEPVTRKELALVIDQINNTPENTTLQLSKADIQELNHLSKSFKSNFVAADENIKKLMAKTKQLSTEQETLHNDLTKIAWDLKKEVKEMKRQRTFLWIGIAVATLLGISN